MSKFKDQSSQGQQHQFASEPKFDCKVDVKSAQYIATYLNDLHDVWQPHKGQVAVGNALFFQGKKRVFVRCGRKWGKALCLETPILTDKGFKRNGDIVAGDIVFDELGRKQEVLVAHEALFDRELFRVHFCDGTFIDSCEEHRWATYTKLDRKSIARGNPREKKIRTTREIFETQMYGKEFNHSVPYCRPVEFDRKDLLLPPYLLGAWLGDGTSAGGSLTGIDDEIFQAFYSEGFGHGFTSPNGQTKGLLGLKSVLRDLGVLNNKHVPEKYLLSTTEHRLELVRGMMDTDGTISKDGRKATYYSTSEKLKDGMVFLLRSLGMKPNVSIKKTVAKDCFVVNFFPSLNVFKLDRKSCRIRESRKSLHRTIVKVEKIPSKPVRCLTVSGESKLYLAGESLVATHNTELEDYILYRWAGTTPNGQFYYIAPFYNQAAEIIWHPGRLKYFLGKHAHKYIEDINETDRRIIFKTGSFIKLVGADNFNAGRGFNPDGAVYDEFKDHDYRFHEGFVDNLITKDAPLLIVGTPPETHDHFFVRTEEDFKLDERGAYFKFPTHTNPYISKKLLELEKASAIRKGEWAKYMREIEAEIVPGGSNAIFPMFEVPRYDEQGNFVGESVHVKEHETLMAEVGARTRDFDFYHMTDPGSALVMATLFVAVNKVTKKVYVLGEVYETDRLQTSPKIHWPKVMAMRDSITARYEWRKGYDYAAAWFQVEIQNEFGEGLEMCEKDVGAKKDFKLSAIKDFMLAGLYVVSKNCKRHINEMATYATDKNGKIPKINDHTIDDLRYIFNMANLHTVPKTPYVEGEDVRVWVDDEPKYEEDIPINVYDFEDEFFN